MAFITEMFLDNDMIEMTPSVSRRLHKPQKYLLNPIIRADHWWEGNQLTPNAAMYDSEDNLFKMWVRCGSDSVSRYVGGHAAYMTYLTSCDGIHWDKPELGLIEFAGRRDHNIIFTGDETDTLTYQGKKGVILSVVKNPNPKDVNEKFVGTAQLLKRRGVRLCTSPDGIRWSCMNEPFWETPLDVSTWGDDGLFQMIYDKTKQKWIIYRRIIPEEGIRVTAINSDRYLKPVDRYYRTFAYAESDNLLEWKNYRSMLGMDADDPADTELYNFACYKYGKVYIGYMSVFHLNSQAIDIQLATSRDGFRFSRVCRSESFIPSGPLGYYDYMSMAGSQSEPIIVNDTVYIYYMACNFPHDIIYDPQKGHEANIGLATFRRDRFASLETGNPQPCRFVTKPFKVLHPKLFLNATTWMKGSIRTEVLTYDWQSIPGFTEAEAFDIQGDALDHPVQWKDNADIGNLIGKEIRLKFYMIRARIYAMTSSDEDRKPSEIDGRDQYEQSGESAPKLL